MSNEQTADPYTHWRRRAETAEARVKQLSGAIDDLFKQVQNKGQPDSHPDNQALIAAGDTIAVNEGALWNLRWVLMVHSPDPSQSAKPEEL